NPDAAPRHQPDDRRRAVLRRQPRPGRGRRRRLRPGREEGLGQPRLRAEVLPAGPPLRRPVLPGRLGVPRAAVLTPPSVARSHSTPDSPPRARRPSPMFDTVVPEIVFWVSLALVAYTYPGYPVVIRCLAGLFGRRAAPPELPTDELPTVSLLIAAHNEESVIA